MSCFDLLHAAEILRLWTRGCLTDALVDDPPPETSSTPEVRCAPLVALRPYLRSPRLSSRPGRSRPTPPPALWPVVATIAWRQPAWQHELAAGVLSHLRRQELLVGAELLLASFRLPTFWFLLLLVAVPQLRPARLSFRRLVERLGVVGWRRRRAARATGRALARVAGEQIATPGWAGFWDQWLIAEVALRHRRTLPDAGADVRRLLAALPLLRRPRYRPVAEVLAPPDPNGPAAAHVDPGWPRQVPAGLGARPAPAGSEKR